MAKKEKPTNDFSDAFIPIELWGRDHWSTLAYVETLMVDHGGLNVEFDPRMRQNRRHFRVMHCGQTHGVPMQPEHGSRLSDGRYAVNHDDWNCVQDFAAAGLLNVGADTVDVGTSNIGLSSLGREIANQLREFKSKGGSFQTFRPEIPVEKVS